jgi:hypothetical protein
LICTRRHYEGGEKFRCSTPSDGTVEPSCGGAAKVLAGSVSGVTSTGAFDTGAFSVESRNDGIADATGVTSPGKADISSMKTPGSAILLVSIDTSVVALVEQLHLTAAASLRRGECRYIGSIGL